MCSCCAWFKSFAVHPIEKASLPEFFDGSINDKHGADVSNFHALSNIGSSHVSNIERKKLYYCSVLAAEASDTRIKAESDNYCLEVTIFGHAIAAQMYLQMRNLVISEYEQDRDRFLTATHCRKFL